MKPIEEMTLEELEELQKAIEAKIAEMDADPAAEGEEPAREGEPVPAEGEGETVEVDPALVEALPDALDALEEIVDQIGERKAALKKTAESRKALRNKVANMEVGAVIRKFNEKESEPKMENEKLYRNAWLKNVQGKELNAEERTALSGGGNVIPQETADKIWGKMELYPLFDAVDVMHIPGTVILPVEGTVNAANVVAMGSAATDSADSIGQVALSIYKIIKTVEITADVAAMAIPAFENWLVDRLTNKLYRKITSLIASGSGSSTVTGLNTIDATGHTYTKAAITYTDVLTIIAALPSEYLPGAKFVMSRTNFFTNVLNIKDSNGNPIVVADRQAPAKYNVLGFEVIIEDDIGTDIVFGDLKEGYVFNFGAEIEVRRDESVGFRTGSTVFRGMALGDGKPTGVGLVRYTKAL